MPKRYQRIVIFNPHGERYDSDIRDRVLGKTDLTDREVLWCSTEEELVGLLGGNPDLVIIGGYNKYIPSKLDSSEREELPPRVLGRIRREELLSEHTDITYLSPEFNIRLNRSLEKRFRATVGWVTLEFLERDW